MNSRSLSQRTRSGFGSNKYRGVSWHCRAEKWYACIRVDGRNKHLGSFDEELDGLAAVNKAYAKYFPNNQELKQVPQKETLLDLNKAVCSKW